MPSSTRIRSGWCLGSGIQWVTRFAATDFIGLCDAWLCDVIPLGMKVRFCRWSHAQLHNRYILTDVGGLKFGQGLDQAGDTEPQEDHVTLLGQQEAAALLDGFIGAAPQYTRDATEVTLTGKKLV